MIQWMFVTKHKSLNLNPHCPRPHLPVTLTLAGLIETGTGSSLTGQAIRKAEFVIQ